MNIAVLGTGMVKSHRYGISDPDAARAARRFRRLFRR